MMAQLADLSEDACELLLAMSRYAQPYTALRRRLGGDLDRVIDALDQLKASGHIETVRIGKDTHYRVAL